MRPDSQRALDALAELWRHYPEWRFGQMLCNVGTFAGGLKPLWCWGLTDDEIASCCHDHLSRAAHDRKAFPGQGLGNRPTEDTQANERKHVQEKLIRAIVAVGMHYPELSTGKLVVFVAFLARGPVPGSLWEVEDNELEEVAAAHAVHCTEARAAI